MAIVVPLRSRGAWTVLPALTVAVGAGVPVAAFALAVVFGVGVEPMPEATWLLAAIAVVTLSPIPVLARRWFILRPPARLVLEPERLTIAYPELLRTPLAVPRALMRVAAVEDDGRSRFRVHASSGPYVGSEDDGYLWSGGWSALPVLAPEGERPNVLLLFEQPIAGADVRRARMRSVYRGEHVAGLLLAADDPAHAERALAPLGLTRPLTMPDVFLLEEQLSADEGGRFGLGRGHLTRWAWASIAVGVIVPVLAAVGAVLGVLLIWGGRRLHGAALTVAGLGVFGVRLALHLG
jgi:hypothetical protein